MTRSSVPKHLFQHSRRIGEVFVMGEGEEEGVMKEEVWEGQSPIGCQVPQRQ